MNFRNQARIAGNWRMMAAAIMALVVIATSTACNKDKACGPTAADQDAAMKAFMTSNGMNGTRHPEGFYYEILAQGSNTRPTSTSVIYCTYRGTLLDGTQFDQATNPGSTGFSLSGVIKGWQLAIPLIGKGGRIKMVLPSELGYGCQGSGTTIPANAPLYFEVNLVDFFN